MCPRKDLRRRWQHFAKEIDTFKTGMAISRHTGTRLFSKKKIIEQ